MIDFSAIWSASRAGLTFDDVKAIVGARERHTLREMGVNVSDAATLKAAYADQYVMAQLKGRQMREMLRMTRDVREPTDGSETGIAAKMKAARERLTP